MIWDNDMKLKERIHRFLHDEKLENVKENEGDKHIKHNTDLSTEDAIKFINRNKNNPFFLYFNHKVLFPL